MHVKSEQKYSKNKARKTGLNQLRHGEKIRRHSNLMHFQAAAKRLDALSRLQQAAQTFQAAAKAPQLDALSSCYQSTSTPCAPSARVSRRANKRPDQKSDLSHNNVGWTYKGDGSTKLLKLSLSSLQRPLSTRGLP